MKRLFVAILACMVLILPIFARGRLYGFACKIEVDKMPERTAYVDMLIPLSENDSEYSSFNRENGEKYGIEEDSEIVTYNRDGFLSYTFRKRSAKSRIEPFVVPEETDATYILFLEDDGICDGEGLDIGEFAQKYKKARFVYIDASGGILGITNEIALSENSYSRVNITLSGKQVACKADENVVLILIALFVIVAEFAISIFVIAYILKLVIFRIKHSR